MAETTACSQETIELIGPDGQVRCQTQGVFENGTFTVFEKDLGIIVGDQLRRYTSTGIVESFNITQVIYYYGLKVQQHYLLTVEPQATC